MAGPMIAGHLRFGQRGISPPFFGILLVLLMPGGIPGSWAAACDEGGASARAAYYELSIAPENATKAVNASTSVKSATYPFQVKNTGDTSLPNCNLGLSPWNSTHDGWSYNFIPSAPFDVQPGGTATVLLCVYPASDAEAKRHTFQLAGKDGVASTSITINLDVLQYGNILVKAPPAQAAGPGSTLEYVFELVNTGNGKDGFVILSVEASIAAITAYLKDGNYRTGEVGYKQGVNKTVVVVIPAGLKTTEGSAGFQLSLSARSDFDPLQDDINWTLIQVIHVYDLGLDISPPSAILVPGERADFNITVLNLGNGDDYVTLNVTVGFDSESWTVSLGRGWFRLQAGDNGTTSLKIAPPADMLPGNYGFTLSALSSGPPLPENPVERSVPANIIIPQLRGLSAPKLDFIAPEPLAAGEAASFSFNFTNIGNVEEAVEIAVYQKPAGWGAIIDVSGNLRLPPKMLQQVNLTVRAPPDRNESPPGKYFIKLRVSNADLSEVLNFTFEVTRRPFNDLDLVAVGPRDIALHPYIQAAHNFTFEVANAGDAVDIVRLTVGGDSSQWGTLQSGMISLGPGERRTVNLTVTVPVGTEGGRIYGLNLTAASENSADIVRSIDFSVIVVVIDLKLPEGSLTCLPRNPGMGTTVKLKVNVENRGNDAAQNIIVAFFGPDQKLIGTKSLPSLTREEGPVSVELDWNGLSEGPNNISVLVDPDNRIPESNETNNRISLTISGYLSDLIIEDAPIFRLSGRAVNRVPIGSDVEVTVTVSNLGNYSLNLENVKVELTDLKTGEKGIFIIDLLPPLGSVNVTFKLLKPKIGTHLISVKVNPDGIIREKTQVNNEKAGTLAVYEGGPTVAGAPFSVIAAVVSVLVVVAAAAIALKPRRR